MSVLLPDALAAMSAALGATAGFWQAATASRDKRRLRSERDTLTELRLTAALESADLDALGDYLFGTVGSVRLSDIATDVALQHRVRQALSLISDFTQTGNDEVTAPTDLSPLRAIAPVEELETARANILSGETWNGLARARRYLEVVLRERLDINGERPLGAGQLVSIGVEQGKIDRSDANMLRYAIKVANRGIHGEDVDPGEALEAVGIFEQFASFPGA